VAIVLALALLVAVFSLARSDVADSQTKSSKRTSVTTMNKYERHLAAAINTTRKRHGLRELKLVPGLMRSAGKHSLQMAVSAFVRQRRQLYHSPEKLLRGRKLESLGR
jgi:uncharacterized protein YkwD